MTAITASRARRAISRGGWTSLAVGGCVLAAALVRWPFVHAGLGMDEAGYAYVARLWAQGATLYRGVWIDRPQGLMLVYRLVVALGHSAVAIRLAALVVGCLVTALLGVIGWLLEGRALAVAAAATYALVGVGPHIEGFTFNGELIATLPSAAAIAAALWWRRTGGARWLVAAGVLAGVAPLMKQSGIDGLVVGAALAFGVGGGRRRRLAAVGVFLGAAAVPLGAALLHGVLVGWRQYWLAVAGYKLAAPSGGAASLDGRLARLAQTDGGAVRDLAPVALAALFGVAWALWRRPRVWVPALWLLAAALGFNLGASYWPHYYVQLVAPLSLAAAAAATRLRRRGLAAVVVAACALPATLFVARLPFLGETARDRVIAYEALYEQDASVLAALRPDLRPRQLVYALDSRADLYFMLGRPVPYPYLWAHPVHEVPGALAQLRATLAGPHRPTWVVVYTPPSRVDPTGRLARILADRYRPFREITRDRVEVLKAT